MQDKSTPTQIPCACGCGTLILLRPLSHNKTQTAKGHHSRLHEYRARCSFGGSQPSWNKGKSYTLAQRTVYANKAAWKRALVRAFGDVCMRCGWDEAPCDAHHLTPKREGGKLSITNGMLLCPNCHRLAEVGKVPLRELADIRSNAELINPRITGKGR